MEVLDYDRATGTVKVRHVATRQITENVSLLSLRGVPQGMDHATMRCQCIIQALLLNKRSLPFRVPLNLSHFRSVDVLKVVEKPMDLTTVSRKLDALEYADGEGGITQEFYDDIHLVMINGRAYHKVGSRPYEGTKILGALFDAAYAILLMQDVQVATLDHIPRFRHLLQQDTNFSLGCCGLMESLFLSEHFGTLEKQRSSTSKSGTKRKKVTTTGSSTTEEAEKPLVEVLRPMDRLKKCHTDLVRGDYKDGLYDVDTQFVHDVRHALRDQQQEHAASSKAAAAAKALSMEFEQHYADLLQKIAAMTGK